MQPRHAFVGVLLAATGVIALTTPATATSVAGTGPSTPRASALAGCRFEYEMSTWPGNFSGHVKVTNTGPDVATNWRITFDLSAGARITSSWPDTFVTSSGRIRVNAPDWQRDLFPGQYTDLGFTGTYTGTTSPSISNVTLNDIPCTI